MMIHHLIWIRTGSGDCSDHLIWILTELGGNGDLGIRKKQTNISIDAILLRCNKYTGCYGKYYWFWVDLINAA